MNYVSSRVFINTCCCKQVVTPVHIKQLSKNLPQVQTKFDSANEDNLTLELILKQAAGKVYMIEAHSKKIYILKIVKWFW